MNAQDLMNMIQDALHSYNEREAKRPGGGRLTQTINLTYINGGEQLIQDGRRLKKTQRLLNELEAQGLIKVERRLVSREDLVGRDFGRAWTKVVTRNLEILVTVLETA